MTHYLTAQLNGGIYGDKQLLSPQGIVTLHTPTGIGSYGMGWVIQGEPGSPRIWHNGDTSNFHSTLLLLPDQNIGIVVLVNVGGFSNSAAINIPIEGVAEILLGNNLTASTNPPFTVTSQAMPLVLLLVPILWIVWSYLSIRRREQRGQFPPHGNSLFWRLLLPLVIDICPVVLAWIFIPAQFHTPMETISLFAPDVFLVIVTITALSLGWAMARIFLALHRRRLTTDASSRAQNMVTSDA